MTTAWIAITTFCFFLSGSSLISLPIAAFALSCSAVSPRSVAVCSRASSRRMLGGISDAIRRMTSSAAVSLALSLSLLPDRMFMALSAEVSSVMSSMVGIRIYLERALGATSEQMHESTASTSSNRAWGDSLEAASRDGDGAVDVRLLCSLAQSAKTKRFDPATNKKNKSWPAPSRPPRRWSAGSASVTRRGSARCT